MTSSIKTVLIVEDIGSIGRTIRQTISKKHPALLPIWVQSTEEAMDYLTTEKFVTTNVTVQGTEPTEIDQRIKIVAVILDNGVFAEKGGPAVPNQGLTFFGEYKEHPLFDPSIRFYLNSADTDREKFENQGFYKIIPEKKANAETLSDLSELTERSRSDTESSLGFENMSLSGTP